MQRFRLFCEARSVFTVQLINVELLTHYAATWPKSYPSSTTRAKVRERIRTFLRYCFQAGWQAGAPERCPGSRWKSRPRFRSPLMSTSAC